MNILLIALVLIALLVLVFLWRRQQKTSGNARKSEEISKPDIVREDPHIPTTQSEFCKPLLELSQSDLGLILIALEKCGHNHFNNCRNTNRHHVEQLIKMSQEIQKKAKDIKEQFECIKKTAEDNPNVKIAWENVGIFDLIEALCSHMQSLVSGSSLGKEEERKKIEEFIKYIENGTRKANVAMNTRSAQVPQQLLEAVRKAKTKLEALKTEFEVSENNPWKAHNEGDVDSPPVKKPEVIHVDVEPNNGPHIPIDPPLEKDRQEFQVLKEELKQTQNALNLTNKKLLEEAQTKSNTLQQQLEQEDILRQQVEELNKKGKELKELKVEIDKEKVKSNLASNELQKLKGDFEDPKFDSGNSPDDFNNLLNTLDDDLKSKVKDLTSKEGLEGAIFNQYSNEIELLRDVLKSWGEPSGNDMDVTARDWSTLSDGIFDLRQTFRLFQADDRYAHALESIHLKLEKLRRRIVFWLKTERGVEQIIVKPDETKFNELEHEEVVGTTVYKGDTDKDNIIYIVYSNGYKFNGETVRKARIGRYRFSNESSVSDERTSDQLVETTTSTLDESTEVQLTANIISDASDAMPDTSGTEGVISGDNQNPENNPEPVPDSNKPESGIENLNHKITDVPVETVAPPEVIVGEPEGVDKPVIILEPSDQDDPEIDWKSVVGP